LFSSLVIVQGDGQPSSVAKYDYGIMTMV